MENKIIQSYLKDLRKALNGADRATIQDALSDAEEHLATALESALAENPAADQDQALENIIQAYGSPEETAAAYQNIEARVQPALADNKPRTSSNIFSRFFGIFGDLKAWGALLYLVSAMLTGIIYFTWAVTGLSLSVSFSIFIFGLPFAAFFLLSTRGIGLIEGRIVEALLGVRMPRRILFFPKELDWKQRLQMLFTNKFTWLVMIYMALQMPLGIVYFTGFVILLSFGISFMVTPFAQLFLADTSTVSMPLIVRGEWVVVPLAEWPVEYLPIMFLAGVVVITATMHLAKFLGGLHGWYAKKLLVTD